MTAAKQLTRDEAIAFAESKQWEPMTHRQRCEFQMEQALMCMPFSVFHEATEKALGRPVWTHEFAEPDRLREELAGARPKGTMADVFESLDRVAGGKAVIVVGVDGLDSQGEGA